MVERWLHDEVSEGEINDGTEEDARLDRRPKGRRPIHRQIGWTAFEWEFLTQWGPSPVVNHYGQLAKLKHEERVSVYIEEFRRLQILVKGWSEESLLGTFIEGLKPWLTREMKLKQTQRLTEVMRMAEILEDSYYSNKKPFKESSGSKNFKSESNKDYWKGKRVIEDSSKKESKDVKKLTNEEVQERIKKGLCFKC
ncbi:hypothetical protein LWI28_004340 [Acer negundo]|uniref:Retrotransposon gag domain-containing protein n=1 Tax=Acer negundo TaxID=4023 RepID=A0AAD5I960_ACENE|nr:hypothetical protein LWI28_004340 [Acer negundo]